MNLKKLCHFIRASRLQQIGYAQIAHFIENIKSKKGLIPLTISHVPTISEVHIIDHPWNGGSPRPRILSTILPARDEAGPPLREWICPYNLGSKLRWHNQVKLEARIGAG